MLVLHSCSKDSNINEGNTTFGQVSEREGTSRTEVYSFYLNGESITESAFLTADTNCINNFVVEVNDTIAYHKCYLFSSNNLYEAWGDSLGNGVTTLNRIDAELAEIADSANLPELLELYPDTIIAWYDSICTKRMVDAGLIESSPSLFYFTGGLH